MISKVRQCGLFCYTVFYTANPFILTEGGHEFETNFPQTEI